MESADPYLILHSRYFYHYSKQIGILKFYDIKSLYKCSSSINSFNLYSKLSGNLTFTNELTYYRKKVSICMCSGVGGKLFKNKLF